MQSLALFLSVSPLLTPRASASEEAVLDREVEIEFEAVQGARQYQVKATPLDNKKNDPLVFTSTESTFLKRLPLGEWLLEVRSLDMRGIAGSWESLGNIKIGFKPPTVVAPKDGVVIKSAPRKTALVEFRWDTFHPNAEFELTITNSLGQEIGDSRKVRSGSTKVELEAGDYSWQIKSLPPKGVTLDGTDPAPMPFKISSGKLDPPTLNTASKTNPKVITWTPPNFGEHSLVTVELMKGAKKKEQSAAPERVIFSEKSETTNWDVPVDLSNGFFRISVISIAKGFEPSEPASLTFQIKQKKQSSKANERKFSPKKNIKLENYDPVDFLQASVGPVLWNYSFRSTAGQSFSLVSGTVTAIDADMTKWLMASPSSAWGFDLRARQTNIYLFEDGTTKSQNQQPVTVSDRRIAALIRKRSIHNKLGIDAILGVGRHDFTFLIQNQFDSTISPVNGQLVELYLGGAIDLQLQNQSHLAIDLTFHPVGTSIGISADQTWQYTATMRFLKQAIHERSFLTFNLENFRSRVNTHSDKFAGTAETISSWYRLGLGLALKI